ncbi:hypothetical protein Bca52824_032321 [Brassica carinata]|uniref:Uncharacterized protein n=1 Tax=Brassica carinata TaxID=52824 RepID=A0A8X7SDY9_BRACI|nr:hypothetical protein Bca52824_032321 [Brassica carinata]
MVRYRRNSKGIAQPREGSRRVEFSPHQYQGRFCPSQDQSSPVHSRRPGWVWPSPLRSTSCLSA